ncbi:MAG: hypothetical protein IJA32_15990 [Lachnospiraceae bacterium]|nr:hypothetical protein [Lachnospiraceae bacterium]
MVTFNLIKKENGILTYKYYPQGNTNAKAGTIELDSNKREISIVTPAEEDFLRSTTVAELNRMHDAINEMRVENGEEPLTEEELLTATEGESWYWFGDHAISKIWNAFREGKELDKGCSMWY